MVAGYIGWMARELVKGRTPPSFYNESGEFDAALFIRVMGESLKRGGGLGIYGDYLLGEYTKQRSFLANLAGPALGTLDPVASILTGGFRAGAEQGADALTGTESDSVRKFPKSYDVARLVEDNTPLLNIFYVKAILDQTIWWNVKEWLSPGIIERTEDRIGESYGQKLWMHPTEFR